MARDDLTITDSLIDTDSSEDLNPSDNIKQLIHFETLLNKGMQVVDTCSTQTWSDTAEHDPGMTLIQALCYATSDVAYRHTLPLVDLLTPDPESLAEAPQQGIFPDDFGPHQALTCGPMTEEDYRRALLDLVSNGKYLFRDARLIKEETDNEYKYYYDTSKRSFTFAKPDQDEKTDVEASVTGGYHLYLELNRDVTAAEIKEALTDPETGFLVTNRNVCEEFRENNEGDVYNVVVFKDQNVYITINIEDDSTAPEKVMAEIYQIVEQTLRPQVRRYKAEELSAQGMTNNAIYQGPNLKHGWIPELPPPVDYKNGHTVSLQSMTTALLAIEGVESVEHLSFEESNVAWELIIPAGQCIRPWCGDPFGDDEHFVSSVKLFKRGQQVTVNAGDIVIENTDVIDESPVILPLGRWRKPGVYRDASGRIPPCYELKTEPAGEKRIPQTHLHQFLLPFEQLLADSCDQLAKLPRLLSFNHRDSDSVRGGQWPFTPSSVADSVHADYYKEVLKALSDENKNNREVELSNIDALLGYFGNARAQRTLEINDGQFESNDFLTIQQSYLAQKSDLVYRRASIQIDDISALQKNIAARLGIGKDFFNSAPDSWADLDFYIVEHRLLLPVAPSSEDMDEQPSITDAHHTENILTLTTEDLNDLQSGQLIDLLIGGDNNASFLAVLVKSVDVDNNTFNVDLQTHSHLSNNLEKVKEAAGKNLTWNYSDVWLKDMKFSYSLDNLRDNQNGTTTVTRSISEPFPVTLMEGDQIILISDEGTEDGPYKVLSVDTVIGSFTVEAAITSFNDFTSWVVDRTQVQSAYVDRFAFCISVVFPSTLFGPNAVLDQVNTTTAAWFQQVVREEVPAHINVLIHWMDGSTNGLYKQFSRYYQAWQSAGNTLSSRAYDLMKSLAIGMLPYTSGGIGVMHVYDRVDENDKTIGGENDDGAGQTNETLTTSEITYVPLGNEDEWPAGS